MFEQLWREDRRMLGIVSLPLVHNLADVLCVGKDVVDQPTRVVLATHGLTGLGHEYLGPQAFGVEGLCDLQAGLLLGGQLEDSFDQLSFGFVDRVSTIDDSASKTRFWMLTVQAGLQGIFSRSLRKLEALRLLWRKCPMSSPVKASNRGPHCPRGTPHGSSANVVIPQQSQ